MGFEGQVCANRWVGHRVNSGANPSVMAPIRRGFMMCSLLGVRMVLLRADSSQARLGTRPPRVAATSPKAVFPRNGIRSDTAQKGNAAATLVSRALTYMS